MSADVLSVCKFYQNGFCKFKEHCRKKHEDKVCDMLNYCRDKTCQESHPQLCRSFSKYKTCRHEEKCAYLHRDDLDPKNKIIEAMTMLLMKHEQDIIHLLEEVKSLKLSNESMSSEAQQEGEKDINAMKETKSSKDLEKNEALEEENVDKTSDTVTIQL